MQFSAAVGARTPAILELIGLVDGPLDVAVPVDVPLIELVTDSEEPDAPAKLAVVVEL